MIDRVKGSEDFESTSFIVFLHHWRKPLVIVTLLAFIASVIFSSPWFITPKYKSSVIMFPTSTNSISKSLLSENTNSKQDILQFGEDEQAEQLLQILNSNRIRDRIVEKFHLLEHYDIKPNEKYKYTKLYNEYEDNIKFSRTEYMAVKITVLDKDPQYAADIANTIADYLDSTKNAMQQERAIMAFRIVEDEYLSLKAGVQKMEDSLTKLRVLGVNDYESQSEMINRQLAIELAKGTNKKGIKALEDKLEVLAKYGGPYVSIRDALEYEKKQLSLVKAKYDEAKIDATEVLPQKFVVSKAYKAEKKSYPVRWIIVVISTLSAFLLALLVLAVLDSLSRYDKKKSQKLT